MQGAKNVSKNPWDKDLEEVEVPEFLVEGPQFPFIQWVNQGRNLTPPQQRGGFATPIDQEVNIDGDYAELVHSNGDTTEVIYTQRLTILPIATRFSWVKDGFRTEYVPGARGKLQVLAFVQASQGIVGPVLVTLTGMASRDMSKALREHRNTVHKLTKSRSVQPWMFWLTLCAGRPQMTGQKQRSIYTPVGRCQDVTPHDYAGREVIVQVVSMAEEVKAWKDAWKETPKPNGDGEVVPEETEE